MEVNIDDFIKLDLRVGKIVSAEKPEWSEKLVRLKVDFGTLGTLVVLSGIAKWYKPEELIGKQAIFLVNLPPRKIQEEISEAMILTAEQEDEEGNKAYCIIQPEKETKAGSRIC